MDVIVLSCMECEEGNQEIGQSRFPELGVSRTRGVGADSVSMQLVGENDLAN